MMIKHGVVGAVALTQRTVVISAGKIKIGDFQKVASQRRGLHDADGDHPATNMARLILASPR